MRRHGPGACHLIVASPADHAFTAVVGVQLTGPQDQQAFDVVLETFNVTPAATWPAPPRRAVDRDDPAPTVGDRVHARDDCGLDAAGADVTTGLPAIGVRLVDETNFLTVTVPADWSDQSGRQRPARRRQRSADDHRRPGHPPRSSDRSKAPATRVHALPPTTDPAALLQRFAYPRSCTDGGITPFDDGRFAGQRQTWLDCDGTTTRVVNVAARPIDGSYHVLRPDPTDDA